jgi:triosephosphate isomerase
MARRMIVMGNWKMNKTPKEAAELINQLRDGMITEKADVVICVPFVALVEAAKCLEGTAVGLGAENLHFEDSGAYTGEVSAPMLKEIGVQYVVIGHSERREYFNETDSTVNKKVHKALEYGIHPILCCGETFEEREDGITMERIRIQVKRGLLGISEEQAKQIIIAYEPIWAIGTGKVATAEQAESVCAGIRLVLAEMYNRDTADAIRIAYGGSVSSENAERLFAMADIDGALVGGASLKPDFDDIVAAAQKF